MSATVHPPYFNRLLAIHGMMGFIQYAVGFSVPLLRRDLHISRVAASAHNIGWAIAVITMSMVIPKFIHRFPPAQLLRMGWLLSTIGILGFAFGKSLLVTLPSFTLAAIGATIFNNTNSAILGSHSPSALKMMLRTTGIGGLFGALAPTVIGVLSHGIFNVGEIKWNYTVSVTTLILATVAFFLIPEIPSRAQESGDVLKIKWNKSFLLLVLFGFLTIWLESGTVTWALDLLVDRGQELKTAVIFVTAVGYFIAISRIAFSFAPKVGTKMLWNFSAVLLGGALLTIVVTDSYSISLAALIVAGFGVGPLGGIALANSARSEQGPDVGVASFALGMGPALGIAPWVMGGVSETLGFPAAYALIFIILILATLLFYHLEKAKVER